MPKIIDAEMLKSTPISIGLLISVVPLVLWAFSVSRAWHFDNFITIAEAEEHSMKVEAEVKQTQRILEDHIEEFRIARAQDRVDQLEQKLYFLLRDQEKDGQTPASQARIAELRHELQDTEVYLDCLIQGRPNCKHLEPGRR